MRVFIFVQLIAYLGMAPGWAAERTEPVTISTLVAQTLAENPEIKFYEAEVLAAKAGRKGASKWPNPELNLDAGRKAVGGSDASAAGLAWAASVAQPIEWPGRLALRKGLASSDVALSELGLAQFKQAVGAKVFTLAYSLAMQQERAAAGGRSLGPAHGVAGCRHSA